MDTRLFVYADVEGDSHLVGTLWARFNKGKQSASFEYDQGWLDNDLRFPLEPALTLGKGPYHTLAGRLIFGAFGDSAPDRWGRRLIERAELRKSRRERRPPRTLTE